jgi:hypothetical protein
MTDYRAAAADYLTTRRAMGCKLAYQGQMRASSPPQPAPGCCATTSAPCSGAWSATRALPGRATLGLPGLHDLRH